jgi:hypothetical protein
MMVVPTGGNDTGPELGCGPTEWWGLMGAGLAFLEAVAAAEADAVLCVAEADPEVVLEAAPEAEFDELDDPPHAASSSTSAPSPVAAVHPLLRMYVSPSQG